MTVRNQGVHLQTAGEGRYLKAYLSYLAGWRELPPNPWHYDLSFRPDRVAMIRDYAEALAEAFVSRT
jgi:hypothetical protein